MAENIQRTTLTKEKYPHHTTVKLNKKQNDRLEILMKRLDCNKTEVFRKALDHYYENITFKL